MAARRGVRNDMAAAAATNEPLRTHRAGTRRADSPANQGRIANRGKSGGGGIRTRVAGLPQSCFQDSRLRPLGHPSAKCASNAPYQYWNGGESGQGSGVYFAMEAMKNILRRLRPRWIPAGGGKRLQDWYRRFNLDSVRINVGVASANISFSDADRDAAWELYIEMLTRIVTQPLPREVGDEQTALDSVYALFGITREILRRQGRDTIQFTKVAVPVLSQVVRPFTAKWHRESLAGAFTT